MITNKSQNNSGFIALISAIIISVILLLIITNLSLTGYYGRSNILDTELKQRSSALAEACIDNAILKLTNDFTYSGGETVTVSGSDTCYIRPMDPSADPIIIQTQGVFQSYTTDLQIGLHKSDLSLASWQELPHF